MPQVIRRGDTERFYFKLYDAAGAAQPLAGLTIWITYKPAISNDLADSDAIHTHHIEFDGAGAVLSNDHLTLGGIDPDTNTVVSTADDGVITQTWPAAETTTFAIETLVFDVQVQLANDEIKTPLLSDSLSVQADITRRVTVP